MDITDICKKLTSIASNVQKVYEAGIAEGASIYLLPIEISVEEEFISSDHVDEMLSLLNERQKTSLTKKEIRVVTVETFDGVKLAGADNYAFQNMSNLRIFIPLYRQNTVSCIGDSAFENCKALEVVDLRNCSDIGRNAFKNCTSLQKVLLCENVTIGAFAFEGISEAAYRKHKYTDSITCKFLGALSASGAESVPILIKDVAISSPTDFELPNDVRYVKSPLFLTGGNLVNKLIINCNEAFFERAYLQGASPNSLSIPSLHLEGDGGLVNRYLWELFSPEYVDDSVPDGLKCLTVRGGRIGNSALRNCTSLTDVTLGTESTCRILVNALRGCSYLKSLNIGEYVNEIGVNAFYGCRRIENISVSNPYFFNVGFQIYQKCATDSLITVLPGNSIQDLTVSNDNNSRNISVSSNAISGIKNLTEITISANVTEISAPFAEDCSNLSTIRVDEKNKKYFVETITFTDYYDDTGSPAETYTLGYALYERYTEDDKEKYKLVRVTPNNVTDALDYIVLRGGRFSVKINTTHVLSGAFNHYCGLSYIKIPSSVESIASDAFSNCSDLRLYFDENVPDGFPYGGSQIDCYYY